MADLPLADRAALFDVIDACCDAGEEFGERLLEALANHLGYRDTTCFSGMDPPDALLNGTVAVRGRARSMLPAYRDRYFKADIFRSPAAQQRLAHSGVTAMHLLPRGLFDLHRPYVQDFIQRAGAHTIYAVQIDAGSAGCTLIGVLDFAGQMDERDVGRLSVLRRVLAAEAERQNRRIAQAGAIPLTCRELEVAKLVARGLDNREIARQLGLRIDTVKKHLTRIYQALGVRNRTQLALRLG